MYVVKRNECFNFMDLRRKIFFASIFLVMGVAGIFLWPSASKADCRCLCRDSSSHERAQQTADEAACVQFCINLGGDYQQLECSSIGVKTSTPTVGAGTIPTFGLNPLCPNGSQDCSPPAIIGRLIRGVLGIVGTLALVMFVYGGFLWMISSQGGNDKKVQYAKDVLVWSTLGLLVIFASYMMVNFIIQQVASS